LKKQPCFEITKKNKFLKDRSLQIIYKTYARKRLCRIVQAWQVSRIFPALICPRRRHTKLWFRKQKIETRRQFCGLDNLAAASAGRRRTKNEKRNIRPNLGSEFDERLLVETCFEKVVQPE